MQYQDQWKKQTIDEKDIICKKFRIQCYIIDIKPESLTESLLYTCMKCNISYNYGQAKRDCCGQRCTLHYEIEFIVKDISIDIDPYIF
jgi:hypothetical protein